MAANGHRPSGSVSQYQNHKAQLANAYNELGKELSSQKIKVVGNYTLGKVIGEGTYGKVRLGVHRLTGTRVAIKQIPKAMSATLTREIHHHRQLHHPHLTQLYEVIATEHNIWLVTELCSGGELFDYLAEKGRLTEDETRILFGQLCLAVAYVHDKGIVHRDLKLENVLLDERCRVKLGDFGFTREFERGALLDTFCGTTGYASPEMLLAEKYLGPEVDVWSLGIILYTLLTGTLPFDDDDDSVMRAKVIKGEYEDPEWLSDESRDLIKNILQIDSAKRLTIAQILAHPWFAIHKTPSAASSPVISRAPSPSPARISSPPLQAQPHSEDTITTPTTFHSASSEFYPSTSAMPEEDVPRISSSTTEEERQPIRRNSSNGTSKTKSGRNDKFVKPQTDTVPEEDLMSEFAPAIDSNQSRPSYSRTTSTSGGSSKAPPAYPSRTPVRTKRRSVSSTLSDPSSPGMEKQLSNLPQDFSSLLKTPAPIIFSTPLERELLNSLSMLGFETGQIVHSVLSDACDATGALWWMLKRKAERKALDEGSMDSPRKISALEDLVHDSSSISDGNEDKESTLKQHTLRESRGPIPAALLEAHSAPELQFIPPTPTVATTVRPKTPPRTHSPTNPLLSPSPSIIDNSSRSHPSTPGGSVKDKDGSKGRKARSGSVSIMQRATTALEAAGLVKKKSAEAVREEKEKEKNSEKRVVSGEEPRISHGSGSSKHKSPPLKAVKDTSAPSTPPPGSEFSPAPVHVGSPWVLASKHSPPPTPVNSPGNTPGELPGLDGKGVGPNRNRAGLLSAFRTWFKEDTKGKRKEILPQPNRASAPPSAAPVAAAIIGRGRGSPKTRMNIARGKTATGRKATARTKRGSMSSRRSSSVNSRRSSFTSSVPIAVLDPSQLEPMSRQRSDPSRRSFGSHTPNSEREDYMSRPSSIRSGHVYPRHRKSPSASSTGRNSPLPKYHRRGGSASSTRVVRQIQTQSSSGRASHLRSNSASSAHSLTSSRQGSLYDLSENEGYRTSSPMKMRSRRRSLEETPRRNGPTTFVAQKRQVPFMSPGASSGYLNSIGRSSWKKSWGKEPPGWQSRSAHPTVEVLAILPATELPIGIRDVFTGRQSVSLGDESDWVDEDDDIPGYAGGLGQMPAPVATASSGFSQQPPDSPLLAYPSKDRMRGVAKRANVNGISLTTVSTRASRSKAGRLSGGRSSPLPNDSVFDPPDTRGGRRQLPPGRSGPSFRHPIQEEDEGEEEE